MTVLLLKLGLVPLLIAAVTAAGRRWGASMAGFLAGLPIIVGPILALLAWEQGATYAAHAALGALAAVPASIGFALAYAWAAQRAGWLLSELLALLAWAIAGTLVLAWQPELPLATLLALACALALPRCFPTDTGSTRASPHPPPLAGRMLAGAVLTLAVTLSAAVLDARISGLLSLFPVMMSVMAIATQRHDGAAFSARLLQGMVRGMISVVAFCALLAALLPTMAALSAFTLATAGALAAHGLRAGLARRPA
ncbi:hypothetical protein [Niveibacterium sp.]|uniref:hypothetical protein n=1 Tax=Niveibacterium sp. TaxID=2017444 RepID=UPI0035B376E9